MISRTYILSLMIHSLSEKKRINEFILKHKNYEKIDKNILFVYERIYNELIKSTEELIEDIDSSFSTFYFYKENELYIKQYKIEVLFQDFVEENIAEKYDINIIFY